jgi:PGF-CTERM protein
MHRRVTLGLTAVVAALALLAVAGGTVVADDHYDHIEYQDVNYTVQFPGDRTPGEQISVIERARSPVDARNMDTARIFTPMDAGPCTDGDIRTFGIDRGSNNSGNEIDEPLVDNYKDDYEGPARPDDPPEDKPFEIWADFWDEEDFQDGTHIRSEDTVILYREDCYVAPEEAGWYQAIGMINGTGYDGGHVEGWAKSNYFWIGDFEDEEEARSELGPPPSERDGNDESTPEPTATAEPTDQSTAEPTDQSTAEPTPTATAAGTGTATDGGSTADGSQSDDDSDPGNDVDGTPASEDGPGFGPVAALVGLLGAVLALRRR